ncbi:MAG: SDR family NAD(P)-dependent oxidoreductase [Actinomycetota bacterium]|nr:SDR family NAD(P)-dependent oxidoreductase [Actinomycetota bacterium]
MGDVERSALVSGANKGLGREVARQLCARGHLVFVGSRDLSQGEHTADELSRAGGTAVAVRLDVTDADSIAAAVRQIAASGHGLDVLVNNAGRIVEAPATRTTAATMRVVFETNVFGAVELTTACLPLLARSSALRVVNVASTTASLSMTAAGHDFGGNAATRMAYASSKSALNMVTVQLAAALREDPGLAHVKVNSATPGFVATDINANQGTRTVAEGARVIVKLAVLPDDGPSGGFFNDQGPVDW